jgi:hypothetical protein
MEYIADNQKPKTGNPQRDMCAFPHKEKANLTLPDIINILNTS